MVNALRKMLDIAEAMGSVEDVTVGDWLPGTWRISIGGKMKDGRSYELILEKAKEAPNAEELE